VEDQPADSGDLTTGAAELSEGTDAKATRRRHRMPLRRQLEPEQNDITAVDVTPQAADVTTQVTEKPESPQPRRRWFTLRRRAKTVEPEAVPAADSAEPDGPAAAPRRPVGKSGRAVKAQEPAAEVLAEVPDVPPDETGAAEEDAGATEPSVEEQVENQVLVPHRPAGRRLTAAAVAAGVLFVGAAGFAGATLQPYLADRAAVDTKLNVARTAASAITTLWTYTPDNMESLPDRAAHFLGGDFANEYRKYIDAIVAPNKQAQVTNTTEVMGAAVETLTPSEATAIVYTNSVATSPVTKNIPSLRYLSYRLTMERRDAKWLITKMSTVTSLDLTPQL
jgi:Mce-associated membrane protein